VFWRLFSYLIFQLGGGLAGWYAARTIEPAAATIGTIIGLLTSGLVWLLIDFARGVKLLSWLRGGDASANGAKGGLWGEITERVRRQLRAREQMTMASDARLQDFLAALQVSPNGVVLLDEQSRIEWFNQMAAAHFGLEAQRDLLQHFGNLVRDPGFAHYFVARDYQRGVIMPGREGTPARPVKLSVHLHPYGGGRLLLLSRDITAVEQAEAMRRDFVANVSHEIRTPLTVLAGFVETLQNLPLNDGERQRYLALMAQQSDRMQTLVSDLLTLSKLEGSPAVGTTEWTRVQLLMEQVAQQVSALEAVLHPGTESARTVQFDQAATSEISGAQNELLSAMTNLACNAVRYTPIAGSIRVRWQELPDGRAEFSVQDTGPGIAAEHLPRLTERFYRVDRSRSRDTGGTGLGLAIVKHVAQRHGAELRIDSTPGKGSTFSLVFPASRVRHAQKEPLQKTVSAAGARVS
jgi:two-component system phosphate regulon sensor histidine kinase PhoR